MHMERFHAEPAIFVAPGRVNLIGEHTDYAEGFVMPAAINFATLAGISPRTDGKIVIYSENYGEEKTFDAAALPPTRQPPLDRLSAGRGADPRRRGPHDSRLQPEPLGRCAARLRAFRARRPLKWPRRWPSSR